MVKVLGFIMMTVKKATKTDIFILKTTTDIPNFLQPSLQKLAFHAVSTQKNDSGCTYLQAVCISGDDAAARVIVACCPDQVDIAIALSVEVARSSPVFPGQDIWGILGQRKRSAAQKTRDLLVKAVGDLKNRSVLHVGAQHGTVYQVKKLLDLGGKVNQVSVEPGHKGATPLMLAARFNSSEVVNLLLNKGASVCRMDKDGLFPLHHAAIGGNTASILRLLENGADANLRCHRTPKTALNLAAKNGKTDVVRVLMGHGATARRGHENDEGTTLLMDAAEGGHLQTVAFLIRSGSDVHALDVDGFSALHYAVRGENIDVVELLLQSNAQADAVSFDGITPLHLARTVSMGRLLVERGCSVHCRDREWKTPLLWAAQKGLTDLVAFFLDSGADISAIDEDDCTALRLAFERGRSDTVTFLIDKMEESSLSRRNELDILAAFGRDDLLRAAFEQGTSVDSRPKNNETLLMVAAAHGQLGTVSFLLDKGTDINLTTTVNSWISLEGDQDFKYELNALHCALANNRRDVARVLIIRGADLQTANSLGESPIHVAAENGLTDIVQLLMECGATATPGESMVSLLGAAVKGGHLETVRFLLDQGADASALEEDGETVLHRSVPHVCETLRQNFMGITKLLIEHGLDIKSTSYVTGNGSLLHLAAMHDMNDTAELLVGLGIDVNTTDANLNTALHFAAKRDNVKLAEWLITHGARLNATTRAGRTPLHKAVEHDSFGMVELLLQRGCDIDIKDDHGWSPLMWAVGEGNLALVHCLLQKGSDVHSRNREGHTPLLRAFYQGISEPGIVKVLLERGSRLDIVDNSGRTSLHVAASSFQDQEDAVRILVDSGANVNKADPRGNTPLHYAASVGNVVIGGFLLQHGANMNVVNERGRSAIHSALCCKHFDFITPGQKQLVQLLVRHGGDMNARDGDGNLPIHLASKAGDATILELCLHNGNHVNDVDAKGRTALHMARGSDVAQYLVQHGADMNALDQRGATPLSLMLDGCSPKEMILVLVKNRGDITKTSHKYGRSVLHEVVQCGPRLLVESLVERGLDVNAVDRNGDTALHRAEASEGTGKTEMFATLISLGGNVKAANKRGQTALHIVLAKPVFHDAREAKALLWYKSDLEAVDHQGNTPLHIASLFSSVDAVEALLEGGSVVNARNSLGHTPLHLAAISSFNGAAGNVQRLLDAGAHVNWTDNSGRTPLHLASMYGSDDNVLALMAHGGDLTAVDDWEMTALHMRATTREGKPATLRLMVQGGADVHARDIHGNTPLHLAAKYSTPAVARILLAYNCDVNSVNDASATPLHLAVTQGEDWTVGLLIQFGAKVNLPDQRGTTPLHLAAVFDRSEAAPILLENGADVGAKDSAGSTAFHLAAAFGSVDILSLLIENGADVQVRDGRGNTACHLAAAKGHMDILKVLLKHGCGVHVANTDGETALHFAAGSGRTDVVKFLVEAGADCWCLDKEGRMSLDCALLCQQTSTVELICGVLNLVPTYEEEGGGPKAVKEIPRR